MSSTPSIPGGNNPQPNWDNNNNSSSDEDKKTSSVRKEILEKAPDKKRKEINQSKNEETEQISSLKKQKVNPSNEKKENLLDKVDNTLDNVKEIIQKHYHSSDSENSNSEKEISIDTSYDMEVFEISLNEQGKKLESEIIKALGINEDADLGFIKQIFDIKNSSEDLEKRIVQLKKLFEMRIKYIQNVKENVINNPDIFAYFFKDYNPNSNFNDFSFKFLKIPDGVDNHNDGSVPIILELQYMQKSCKVMYKPRSGEVDAMTMELFSKLDKIFSELGIKIPVYKILNCKSHSIHEFVEGKTIINLGGNPNNPFSFIKEQKNEDLYQAFLLLEYLSRQIGLTDLHGDNILINGNQIIIVDLEVFLDVEGAETIITNLIGEDSKKELTQINEDIEKFESKIKQIDQFKKAISDFNQKISSLEVRFVPIATSTFNENMGNMNFNWHKTFKESFEDLGYGLIIDEEKLRKLLKNDFSKQDIPYFTRIGKEIYYGGEKIGQKTK